MQKVKLVIIGSGPAGFTAAIYAARANIAPLLFEGFFSGPAGGQLMTTTEVENYPGFPDGISGPVLMDNCRRQSLRFGTTVLTEDVEAVDFSSHPYKVFGKQTLVEAIVSSWRRERRPTGWRYQAQERASSGKKG